MTKARGSQKGFWLFQRQRMTDIHELGLSQGFPRGRLQTPPSSGRAKKSKVSNLDLGGMYGNSFCVTTILRILCRLLPAAGLVVGIVDPFGDASTPSDSL